MTRTSSTTSGWPMPSARRRSLVTCSSVSRAVARVRDRAAIPLFAIDDPMAAEAVRIGGRITVVATAPTTLAPSRELLEATAARSGRAIEVRLRMVDGALPALLAGDAALHDRLVVTALREAEPESDVIVLAQATMARVLEALADEPLAVPVLASPQLALAAVRKAIHDLRPTQEGEMHQHTDALALDLARKAQHLRMDVLDMVTRTGTGHLGGPYSAAEILSALYFHQLRIDPARPDWPERDRFLLSKGHAAPILYAVLARRGFYPDRGALDLPALPDPPGGPPGPQAARRGDGRRTPGPRRGRGRRHGLVALAGRAQAVGRQRPLGHGRPCAASTCSWVTASWTPASSGRAPCSRPSTASAT